MQTIEAPDFLEKVVKRYVKKTFFADTRKKDFASRVGFTEGDYRFFVKGVRELNISFTQERHSLPKNYFNKKEFRSGYILYFLPVNALKVASLLAPVFKNIPEEGPITLKILDMGSGPGTGLIGVLLGLAQRMNQKRRGNAQLEFVLVDQNKEALQDASRILEEMVLELKKEYPGWGIETSVRVVVANLFSQKLSQILPAQPFDLILSLNFLSELPREKRGTMAEILLRHYLHQQGRFLIMEPALRVTTRDLMELRDRILEKKIALVEAPCLHQEACPMLRANQRDWCHAYIPWERPGWIERLDYLAGIRKEYLKCSYLLLSHDVSQRDAWLREKAAPFKGSVWRVVSGPLNSNGKSERLLCGPADHELLRLTRLDRDASPLNHDFENLERGDLVVLPKVTRLLKDMSLGKIS